MSQVALTVVSLGTAATKNVAAAGNASSNEIVMGNDTRLSGAGTIISTFVFDGSGSVLTSGGITNGLPRPTAFTITGYTIVGEVNGVQTSGSAVVDIKKATGGSASFTSIVASAPPTLSSASYQNSSTLTGWTTSVTANSTLKASLTSVSTFTTVTVTVYGN